MHLESNYHVRNSINGFNMKSKTSKPSRRKFLHRSSKLAAAGAIIANTTPAAFGYHNSVADTLKIGLVGCGGRGTGAIMNAVKADDNVQVHAFADAFSDRIQECHRVLNEQIPKKMVVPEERWFTGFDCHQKLIDSGVDVVLLATPPHFRPMQMTAAINAGKHVFCEKPVGVDVPGTLEVLEACKLAKEKGLCVVSGLCWRYDIGVNAVMDRILSGEIGDIQTIQVNYLTGTLWHRGSSDEWSQMEYQLRNWLYYTWLSGDHIAEQHIHSLDKAMWLMGDKPPESCYGSGGRLVRTNEKWGNVYDHFSPIFEWENGVKVFSNCRQMSECFNNVDDYVTGTTGNAQILKFKVNDKKVFTGDKPSMYDVEHKELFAAIRRGDTINNGEYMCNSTLMAIMGREACYTGKKIKWDKFIKSTERLGPKSYEWGDFEPKPVAKPGGSW